MPETKKETVAQLAAAMEKMTPTQVAIVGAYADGIVAGTETKEEKAG